MASTKRKLVVLLAAAVISACASAQPPKANIEHLLANARTATDHEAIAQYYEDEAADATLKSQQHKAAAVQYTHNLKFGGMARHCDSLSQEFRGVAQDASVLAAEHRRIATEMKSGETTGLSIPSAAATPLM